MDLKKIVKQEIEETRLNLDILRDTDLMDDENWRVYQKVSRRFTNLISEIIAIAMLEDNPSAGVN